VTGRSLRLRYGARAEIDLLEVHAWIARDNPEAASRTLRRIGDACLRLQEFPDLGRDRSDLSPGMRTWVVGPFNILYRRDEQVIDIVRVVHGRRDIRRLIDNPES
jgi:toxin ParE1/3/4